MKKRKGYLWLLFASLAVLAVLGRVLTALYNYTYNDITFDDWIPSVFSYAAEIVTGIRIGVSIGALCHAAYRNDGYMTKTALIAGAASLLDCVLRFVIDLINSAIDGNELLAVIWLAIQLLFELLVFFITNAVSSHMRTKQLSAETSIMKAKYSVGRASLVTVLLYAAANIAVGAVDIIDFLTEYSDITNAEIASMTGSVIKIIVISGGVVYIFADITISLLAKKLAADSQ